jgi:hypothetical protein
VLVAGCGSEPPPGLLDGSWPTGNCSNGATGQRTCTPDPGSKPVDCTAAETDLEFLTVGDFSESAASRWYAYIDRSGLGKISSFSKGWEPDTVPDPFPRCGNSPAKALHLQGGPFLGWGGGFGTAMKDAFPTPMINVSGFEGVAVWARRGPDSQGGIRINVGDQNTDDDISYLMYQANPKAPRNCERVRECGCTNHQDCLGWAVSPRTKFKLDGPSNDSPTCDPPDKQRPDTAGGSQKTGQYCGDPASDTIPGYQSTSSPSYRCNSCSITRCDEPYEAYPNGTETSIAAKVSDAQFNGKPCTPYVTRAGSAMSFCFDPATDPPPAESDQQCGDHWISAIYLTNQWTLYLVPFTDMLQQGFGKRSAKMDLTAVTMVRLTWDGGYVDYWIGKVAFYKHKSH